VYSAFPCVQEDRHVMRRAFCEVSRRGGGVSARWSGRRQAPTTHANLKARSKQGKLDKLRDDGHPSSPASAYHPRTSRNKHPFALVERDIACACVCVNVWLCVLATVWYNYSSFTHTVTLPHDKKKLTG
jgi:hypothetical protein